MLTIGIDAHKRVHAAVAIDAAGREQGLRNGCLRCFSRNDKGRATAEPKRLSFRAGIW